MKKAILTFVMAIAIASAAYGLMNSKSHNALAKEDAAGITSAL